jgi:RNA polymerase sigma-70 factor (sigma-E family)
MRRSQRRDAEFTAFVAAQSAALVQFARYLSGDAVAAEDLVQHALERVYKTWRGRDIEHPLAYTRRTMLNLYISGSRTRWREQPVAHFAQGHQGTVIDHAAAVTNREAILAALGDLTARERAVVLLRYQQDLTEAAAARELGVQVGTIKSTTARALAKMRRSAHLQDHPTGRPS